MFVIVCLFVFKSALWVLISLVSKWCDAKFLNIWWRMIKKQLPLHLEWPKGEYTLSKVSANLKSLNLFVKFRCLNVFWKWFQPIMGSAETKFIMLFLTHFYKTKHEFLLKYSWFVLMILMSTTKHMDKTYCFAILPFHNYIISWILLLIFDIEQTWDSFLGRGPPVDNCHLDGNKFRWI